ncbi:MAG: hypothetical protein JNK87_30050 [Bryobacterales bacterium]|nr:hypothetical protein [Bryobacterales bacterium]
MENHLKVAGLLNIALGVLGLLFTVFTLVLFGGPRGVLLINARQGGSTTTTEGFFTMCAIVYLFLMAGPLIGVGLGLIRYQEWARNLGMILSIFSLVIIPVGTIVGIHSLWVLTSFEVEPLFKNPPSKPLF